MYAKLLTKVLFPSKLITVLLAAKIPPLCGPSNVAIFSRKVVFPVNVRLLLTAVIPLAPLQVFDLQWLCLNWLFPAKVMLEFFTTSAVARLSWK